MRLIIFFCMLFGNILTTYCQNITPNLTEIFRDDVISRIDIQLPADSLAYLLHPDNEQSNYLFHADFIFDNTFVRDTLENVGFRLRGNTSRGAGKKSWKISFNTYESGRKYYGLEKMNINGEHNDPTIFRSKLAWDIARQIGLVGSRCNHVNLYINNEYFGIYANVEHIDEEFVEKRFGNKDGNLYKCLYPADLDYLGTNPDLYKLEVFGRPVYQLKTNTFQNDYTQLANFIDVLNNTPTDDLPCELEQVFNLNQYLKYIAFDVLIGNWDGPIFNKNNFYLYENPSTGLVEYIPYDLDNTFGIDWFNINWAQRNIYQWSKSNEPRPIYTRLMENTELRNRFTFYLKNMIFEVFNETNLSPHIDSIKLKMDFSRLNDPYASADYGYDFSDYENAFTQALNNHEKYGLKQYIPVRVAFALGQAEQVNIIPIISLLKNNFPNATQDISVTAFVEDDDDLSAVELFYQLGNQTNMTTIEMFDDGAHQDGVAGDGIFGTIIPALGTSAVFNYFVKATDATGKENRYPKCVNRKIYISNANLPLYINELMASNNAVIADEAGEYDDWVEIYNGGDMPIYLGDKFLSDNLNIPNKWQMPNILIQPNEFLLFWADKDENQGANHANFKLSASGEYIGIFDAESNNFGLIDGTEFGEMQADEALARLPNGTGDFQIANPTPSESNTPVSVDFLEKKLEVKVFPNPTDGFVNILLEKGNAVRWKMKIVDQLGQVVFEKENLSDSVFSFSLKEKSFSAGIYFVKIEMEDGDFWSGKIVVK